MDTASPGAGGPAPPPKLPPWALELIELYESNAANQFIVHGNVWDRMVIPGGAGGDSRLGTLGDFLLDVLMPRFDVVLSYDVGNGIRVEKGGEKFSSWPFLKETPQLPRAPRAAVETLTHYFRYCANLRRLNRDTIQVGCILRGAELLAPAYEGGVDYDLSALATLIRDWASDSLLTSHALATFLVTENLNDLHGLIVNNPRTAHIKISLPTPRELAQAFAIVAPRYGVALSGYAKQLEGAAHELAGTTLAAIEGVLKTKEHSKKPLVPEDLSRLKKQLVEKDCKGLIEFVETSRTLDDLQGIDKIKAWLRQDVVLWRGNDVAALPKGYLICGPVGTGKTYLVECLAGEAGVPVVKMKNFRDKWVGSTEGNLETIFRLIEALGRCYVFVDEADQALGRRDSGSGDSGISGRIYSMIAEEMGSSTNRGRIIWVLASSRPDLIEVDLKRPGRVDVKLPLFPTTTPREGFDLIRALCRKRGMAIEEPDFTELESLIPPLLTPGAAETLAVKVYRLARMRSQKPAEALRGCLGEYKNPVPQDVLEHQIRLAVKEASDLEFVPPIFLRDASTAPTR